MCLLFLFPFQLVKQLFYFLLFIFYFFIYFFFPTSRSHTLKFLHLSPPFFLFFKASGYLVTGWMVGRQWLPSLGETARPGMATDNKKERKEKKKRNKKEDTSCITCLHSYTHPRCSACSFRLPVLSCPFLSCVLTRMFVTFISLLLLGCFKD